IELARQRFPQVGFICGQAPDAFAAEQRSGNLFLLMDVMEHVAEDFAFFSRLWQALTPGTQLLLTVPADDSLWSVHDTSFGHYRGAAARGRASGGATPAGQRPARSKRETAG